MSSFQISDSKEERIIYLEYISDTMWPNGFIGIRHLNNAINKFKKFNPLFKLEIHRIPFFLEPGYMNKNSTFTETHNTRMIRKFGSQEGKHFSYQLS